MQRLWNLWHQKPLAPDFFQKPPKTFAPETFQTFTFAPGLFDTRSLLHERPFTNFLQQKPFFELAWPIRPWFDLNCNNLGVFKLNFLWPSNLTQLDSTLLSRMGTSFENASWLACFKAAQLMVVVTTCIAWGQKMYLYKSVVIFRFQLWLTNSCYPAMLCAIFETEILLATTTTAHFLPVASISHFVDSLFQALQIHQLRNLPRAFKLGLNLEGFFLHSYW